MQPIQLNMTDRMRKLDHWLAVTQFKASVSMRLKLYRKIRAFLRNGVSLHDTFKRLHMMYSHKKSDPRAAALDDWMTQAMRGVSWGVAIRKWAPASEAMLIDSGERSGQIVDTLTRVIEMTEAMRALRKTLVSNLAYPVVVFVVLVFMIIIFGFRIVPQMADIIPPEQWPGVSKTLYVASTFLNTYIVHITLAVVGIGYGILYSLPRWNGRWRLQFDRIPPWSVYRAIQSAAFLVSLSSLMRAGSPLQESIEKLRRGNTPYVSVRLAKMIALLKSGVPNGRALNTGLLSNETALDMEAYGEVADFQKAMEDIGTEVIEETGDRIKSSTNILGTCLLVMTGVFVGWVMYSFFTLATELANSAGKF